MSKFNKTLSIVLSFILIMSMLIGCSRDDSSSATTTTTTTRAVTTTTKATTTTTTQETTVPEEKITITMLMSNSGLGVPDGVSVSDNKFVNIIKELANVDLEIEVPLYADFGTRLNLILASGDIPDIVHSQQADLVIPYAMEGAFIDLYDYWEGSEAVRKYITPEFMELAKSSDGGYHRIPMKYDSSYVGTAMMVQYNEVLEFFNDGEWPESVDEWVEVWRRLAAADIDERDGDFVITMRVDHWAGRFRFWSGGIIPFMYGARWHRYDLEDQKVYAQIQLPEFKAALETMKLLFQEGLIDKEFVTNDSATYRAKMAGSKAGNFNLQGIGDIIPANHIGARTENLEWIRLPAPPLKVYPEALKDPKYAQEYAGMPISGHGMFIASKAKNPDRAWRVIEAFASDELYDAIFWGWEGATYAIENGNKVPNYEALIDANHRYGLAYAFIFGFDNGQEVNAAYTEQMLGKEYNDMVLEHIKLHDEMAKKNGINPMNFAVNTDEGLMKTGEANDAAFAIAVEYVMGRITSEEYDKRVEEWTGLYGFIYDEQTESINSRREELISYGVKFDR